jgi:endonuclease I
MMRRVAVGLVVLGAAALGLVVMGRTGMIGTGRFDGVLADRPAAEVRGLPAGLDMVAASVAGSPDPDMVAIRRWLHDQVSGNAVLTPGKVVMALEELEADPADRDHVVLIYSGRSVPAGGADGVSWQQEHLWPPSHGFDDRADPAYADLVNLRLEDVATRARRGAKDFADVTGRVTDSDGFEPPDRVKGDIARALFYMVVRYEGDAGGPDLKLVDRWTRDGEPMLGKLCTLLRWSGQDPVDADERRRNTRVERYQGNRNPFIDRPEFAQVLWGKRCA